MINATYIETINNADNLDSYITSFQIMADSIGYVGYLVDINNKIIAVSAGFKQWFKFSNENKVLNKTIHEQSIPNLQQYKKFADILHKQYEQLRNTKTKHIYLEVFNNEETADITISHKTPIFDKNGKFLCTNIQIRPFVIARLANLGAKFFKVKGFPTKDCELRSIKLTRIQQMVLYVYARNYSYKEVSIWLTHFGHKISPTMVNKHLDKLKTLLGAPDKESLRDMSLKLGYDVALPAEFVPEGSHDITDDVFDLWVC